MSPPSWRLVSRSLQTRLGLSRELILWPHFYREGISVMNVTQLIGFAEEGVFPSRMGTRGAKAGPIPETTN
jgi:hypothetical protein